MPPKLKNHRDLGNTYIIKKQEAFNREFDVILKEANKHKLEIMQREGKDYLFNDKKHFDKFGIIFFDNTEIGFLTNDYDVNANWRLDLEIKEEFAFNIDLERKNKLDSSKLNHLICKFKKMLKDNIIEKFKV